MTKNKPNRKCKKWAINQVFINLIEIATYTHIVRFRKLPCERESMRDIKGYMSEEPLE